MPRRERSIALPAAVVRPVLRLSGARSLGGVLPLGLMRRSLDRFAPPATADVDIVRGALAGVPGEWVTPPSARRGAVLLYLHGGAFVSGSVRSHRRLVSRLAMKTKMRCFSVDYRLAPEHSHPAALDDVLAVYHQLLKDGIDPSELLVAGDSAGGWLALALSQHLRDAGEPMPAAVGLICPWLDLGRSRWHGQDPMLGNGLLQRSAASYLPGVTPASRRATSPLHGDLSGLPPLVVDSVHGDPLEPDVTELLDRGSRAGATIDHRAHEAVWHDIHMFAGLVREADTAVATFSLRLVEAAFATRLRVGIVGAGMSGIGMGVRLKQAGIEQFTILEKGDDVGGTWRENTYPGLTCDVPSSYYSYTFALRPNWTAMFAPQPQIYDYLRSVAEQFDVRSHIRCEAEVATAEWVDQQWVVTTTDGFEDEFDVLVCATGILHHPQIPSIPGLDTFAGDLFHSARWDHDVDVGGRRVAVVGTGSTGAQITSALSTRSEQLYVFQRTPQWVLPIPNIPYPPAVRRLMAGVPFLRRLLYRVTQHVFEFFASALTEPGLRRWVTQSLFRLGLRLHVRDSGLREKLTPPDQPLCKRGVISGDFYKAVQRRGVEVVTDGIVEIEPAGIRTEDGTLHEVDVIVFATGFDAHAYMRPMGIRGVDRTLETYWANGPRAYRSVALPGFPNLFTVMGPHSPVGNYSLIAVAETQIEWIMQWIERLRRGEIRWVMPTDEATDRYNHQLREAMDKTVWASGCNSWYIGPDGLPNSFPWTPQRFRKMLQTPKTDDFVVDRDQSTEVKQPRFAAVVPPGRVGERFV